MTEASVLFELPEKWLIISLNSTIESKDHTFFHRPMLPPFLSALQAVQLSPRRRTSSSNRSQFSTRLSSSPIPSPSQTHSVDQAREVVRDTHTHSLSLPACVCKVHNMFVTAVCESLLIVGTIL